MHLIRFLATLLIFFAPHIFGSANAAEESTAGSIVITLPAQLTAEERESLIGALDQLKRPLVVEGAEKTTAMSADTGEAIAGSMDRFDAALAASNEIPVLAERWWSNLSLGEAGAPPLLVLVAIAVALVAGAACSWVLDRLLGRWRRKCIEATPQRFSDRFGYASAWVGLELLEIAAFAVGSLFAGWLLMPANEAARLALAVAIAAVVKMMLMLVVARFIFAPHRPTLRLVAMPDGDARRIWRWIVVVTITVVSVYTIRDLIVSSGAHGASVVLLGLAGAAISAAMRLAAVFAVRVPIRDLILRSYGPADGAPRTSIRLAADLWHVIFAILIAFDFAGTVYNELTATGTRLASASVGSFFVLALLPFLIGGYNALIDDALLGCSEEGKRAGLAGAGRAFGQGAILIAVFVFLARAWGADPFAGADATFASHISHAVLQVGAAFLLGWTIWQGFKFALDRYAADGGDGTVSEDGMGKPGSRLATVLPVLRGFVFIAIVAIAAMTALSAVGIDIGPLLAGAGILGLAVGFGAQTLVKDIITGLFYLAEDAFRKGEYIETKAGKGVVEKISLRSVQLRHHNGPLHTIPFGSMGNITNHSRDWVRVKFQIRVPFDTDLNRLRKAIKSVGQEMQEDPELGPLFLEPIKSQGAVSTDDSGFMTSVKFMCRPGQQFSIRREAYARIQKAFAANGIEFASRRVTVDSEFEGAAGEAAAAAAAARD